MKNSILFIILIFLLSVACGNNENTMNQEEDTVETIEISDEDIILDTENPNKLEKIIDYNKLAIKQLHGLKSAIEKKDEIKSVQDIEKVLRMRDSLVSLLLADDKFVAYMEEGDRLYKEFENLGIHVVEGEGLFFGLDKAPLMEKVIEKVADEPYILKNKVENLYGLSSGSEYPYYDISEEMEIVPLAEKMLTKYPNHKYNKQLIEIMKHALYPLVEVHQVKVGTDHISHIVGGYDVSDYPGATDISFHKNFVNKTKNSRYSKVVGKIIESISTIESPKFEVLYFVEVPDLADNDSAFTDGQLNQKLKNLQQEIKEQDSWFKYLWLGVDIAHTLNFWDGENRKAALVYRFFDKKAPAEKSLEKIRKIIPSAKLVEYKLTEEDKKYRN